MPPHTLHPYQTLIITESDELRKRISHLEVFMMTETFRALDEAERDRLRLQLSVMRSYDLILDQRMKAWDTDHA